MERDRSFEFFKKRTDGAGKPPGKDYGNGKRADKRAKKERNRSDGKHRKTKRSSV